MAKKRITKRPSKAKKVVKVYESDGDSEEGNSGVYNPVPLPSLENRRTKEFDTQSNNFTKEKKRKRKEKDVETEAVGYDNGNPNNSKKKKKKQANKQELSEADKRESLQETMRVRAEKVVWRKFQQKNMRLQGYYKKQFLHWTPTVWEKFHQTVSTPPTIFFYINGNMPSIAEIVRGSLQHDFSLNGSEVILSSGQERVLSISPVEYIPNETIWQINVDTKNIRKTSSLREFNEYINLQCSIGSIIRQDLTSILPAYFLRIKSGDSVLDICGRGGKRASQLCEFLHEDKKNNLSGLICINDEDSKSVANTIQFIQKTVPLSSPVLLTSHKPEDFPELENGAFTHVLCNVPCSGDGSIRKNPELWRTWNPSTALKHHSTQLAILKKSMQLLVTGGHVVYCTRSLNPIENEAVVAEVLKCGEGSYELVDCNDVLPGLKRSVGLLKWKVCDDDIQEISSWLSLDDSVKNSYRSSMWPPSTKEAKRMNLEKCVRIFPQECDSNGLFIAVLKKMNQVDVVKIGPSLEINRPKQQEMKSITISKKNMSSQSKHLGFLSTLKSIDFETLQKMYGFSAEMKDQFFVRTGFSQDKSVYFVTSSWGKLLQRYGNLLYIIHAGTKLFKLSNKKNELKSRFGKFDVLQEGVKELLHASQNENRIVAVSKENFEAILLKKEIWLRDFLSVQESSAKKLNELEAGGLIITMDEMELIQTADLDFCLAACKSSSSLRISTSPSEIHRFKVLLSELDAPEENYDDFSDA